MTKVKVGIYEDHIDFRTNKYIIGALFTKEDIKMTIFWIRECSSTTMLPILFNGNPTNKFSVGKGLRQGGPLFSFLFLIIDERYIGG
ncbi:hypothetical protein CR513_18319, partial [Mucuna pruriens]